MHVDSRAYFVPKLVLIVLALLNTTYGHRRCYGPVLRGGVVPARRVSLLSVLLWTGVIVCSCLNTEAMPKVFLRW